MDENIASARDMIRFGNWAVMEPERPEPKTETVGRKAGGKHVSGTRSIFWRNHKIAIIAAAVFTVYSLLLIWRVDARAVDRVRTEELAPVQAELTKCREELKAYQDKEYEQSKQYFLSGEASREAFINQEIDAVAPVIAKLSTDAQKQTELGCFIARHKNPAYPNSFQELAEQPQQWPLYNGKDKTYSQHDRDLTETMLRAYLESGIMPSGLTQDMVYASWSQNDLILRDSWEATSTMNTWRYAG